MDDNATYEQAWIDRESDERYEKLLTPYDRCWLYAGRIECGAYLL